TAFVIGGVAAEPSREGEEAWALLLHRKRGDDARVQTPAEVGADRDVRAQVQRDRLRDQVLDRRLEIHPRVVEVRLVVDLPVPAHRDLAVADGEHVARQELANALEKRLAAQAELDAEVVLQSVETGP